MLKNKYRIENDFVYIIMDNSKHGYCETRISLEDMSKILSINGSIYPQKDKQGNLRANIYFKNERKYCQLSRYILDAPKSLMVDHINHNTLDNTRNNLRFANASQNTQNQGNVRSDNKSGYRGVLYRKREQKWLAYAYLDGKRHELGLYNTPEEANEVVTNFRAMYQTFSKEHREIKNPSLPKINHVKGKENKSCGVKGITYNKQKQKYFAQIRVKDKLHRSRGCDTLEEAIDELNKLKNKLNLL
ncbi:AP2 domain-containing protein [Desulfosporosinus sp. FKA]|uniref:AP2 domain-containing protein n=1 Tax=Desulfosporosinus sp. FKA TaxID=1969834 RepID=UPI000B49746D|nr:AP2 domain-containing protein [Desulfosporosinus sp. FKA]